MESDREIISENQVDTVVEDNEMNDINEDNSFEISEEAKEQSRKFFKFGNKPKKENRKFESFEIVKTYTPKEKPKKDNEFDKLLEISNNQTTTEETISVSSKTAKQQVKLRMRPQGKLLLILISTIIILLSSFCIYNAVSINNLNKSIDSINNQITIEDFKIDKAIKNLESLNEDAVSNEQAVNLDLEKAETYKNITLYERKDVPTVKSSSNWFNVVCNFISKLFGG